MKATIINNNSYPFWTWTFKAYDLKERKWFKSNCPNLECLEEYRQVLLKNKRYCNISNCYQRNIAQPNAY